MRFISFYFVVVCGLLPSISLAQVIEPKVQEVREIPDANAPELVYWFTKPDTIKPENYKADIHHIVHDSPFTFAFLTPREGFDTGPAASHDGIKGLVAEAHAQGLKVGLQLPLHMGARDVANCQTMLTEAEVTLDGHGDGTVTTHSEMRYGKSLMSRLAGVWTFHKVAEMTYDAHTLHDVTAASTGQEQGPGVMQVTVHGGVQAAGSTAYVLVENTYPTLDLFSEAFSKQVLKDLDEYSDVPLDGTALDEFGYTALAKGLNGPFRDRFGGQAFAAAFERERTLPFMQTLFEMRYHPDGHPEVTIHAIDAYFDHLRQGPLRAEQLFYDHSRQVFGQGIFSGIHDTRHNKLVNDEIWSTGINWWRQPRYYGQSDEDLALPIRMGLLVSHPANLMYDQFYGRVIPQFATKAMHDALFDARLHYHGYNDTGVWGVDLSSAPFLSVIDPVEGKIRLLNQFNPAAPYLPLLVVFGMPAQTNWFPDAKARNQFDVNGSMDIVGKANAIWDAGFRCAVVPTDVIDSGDLTLNAQGFPTLHGHTFKAVVFLYPEYSKPSTIKFLQRYVQTGHPLMTEGTLTRGFDGTDASQAWAGISSRAAFHKFSVSDIPKLGVSAVDPAANIGMLEDGSIIETDLPSLQSHKPIRFKLNVAGHVFSGSYAGVLAMKTDASGNVEKFACGECGSLEKDGAVILKRDRPADLVLWHKDGGYQMLLQTVTH